MFIHYIAAASLQAQIIILRYSCSTAYAVS